MKEGGISAFSPRGRDEDALVRVGDVIFVQNAYLHLNKVRKCFESEH